MSVITPAELAKLAELIADGVEARMAGRPRLVDRHGLAVQLNVSVPTVDRLRAAGCITAVMVGSKPMFDVDAVIADLPGGCDA